MIRDILDTRFCRACGASLRGAGRLGTCTQFAEGRTHWLEVDVWIVACPTCRLRHHEVAQGRWVEPAIALAAIASNPDALAEGAVAECIRVCALKP